jgi:hypothetical protein
MTMAETAIMSPTEFRPLRLLAEDADDLAIIAAALQEAEARIGDIEWDPTGRRLTLALNRLRRESAEDTSQRVRAGVQLGGVLGVKTRRLDRADKDAVVQLLTVTFEEGEAPGGVITFAFADGGDLAATVECIDAALADVSEPWTVESQST